jgi:hypothetical protein
MAAKNKKRRDDEIRRTIVNELFTQPRRKYERMKVEIRGIDETWRLILHFILYDEKINILTNF